METDFKEPSPKGSGKENDDFRNKNKFNKDQGYGIGRHLTFDGRLECFCGLGPGCTQC